MKKLSSHVVFLTILLFIFIIGVQQNALPFGPQTYEEILLFLRKCLRDTVKRRNMTLHQYFASLSDQNQMQPDTPLVLYRYISATLCS